MFEKIKRWIAGYKFREEAWLLWKTPFSQFIEFVPLDMCPWAHTTGTRHAVDIDVRELITTDIVDRFVGVFHLHSPQIGAQLSKTDFEWLDGWVVAVNRPIICGVFDGTDLSVYQSIAPDAGYYLAPTEVLGFNFYVTASKEVPGFSDQYPMFWDFSHDTPIPTG